MLSVDWFMGIAYALGNLIRNCVATVAITAWEVDIDHTRVDALLEGTWSPEDDILVNRLICSARYAREQPLSSAAGLSANFA